MGNRLQSGRVRVVAALSGVALAAALVAAQAPPPAAQPAPPPAPANPVLEGYKREVVADIEARRVFTQQMVDQVFSFAEPAFQEVETGKYLAGILEHNGFAIQRGYAGIPTAWVATWGSGKPVIALGSDERLPARLVAASRRRLSRSAGARRAWPWRGAQLRRAPQHHGGAGRETDHGAQPPVWHIEGMAGHRGGSGRRQGLFRPGRPVQRRGYLAVCPRRIELRSRRGARAAAPGCNPWSTPSLARARMPR